jgi:hypothetical protein
MALKLSRKPMVATLEIPGVAIAHSSYNQCRWAKVCCESEFCLRNPAKILNFVAFVTEISKKRRFESLSRL